MKKKKKLTEPDKKFIFSIKVAVEASLIDIWKRYTFGSLQLLCLLTSDRVLLSQSLLIASTSLKIFT